MQNENGEFAWTPDWAATTAASTIGVVADITKEGLKEAAISSGDDLARNISRGVNPAAIALGTVPAIANDIESGMDPAKAVVTESAASALGGVAAWAGAKGGAALGTMITPGVGTAVGFVAGALAGGLTTYISSKGFQALWD
ncbi:hypothetical protein ACRAJ3_16685 [Rhodococcus pyridinivorans]|uniref:hypothetical protein n=1 Tax=Rhodococcus pyridinivorans TaxID=103816 RepID=UPI003D7F6CBD